MTQNNSNINMLYLAHESEVARLERVIKRIWILCIILFIGFVSSNCAWIVYENSFSDEITTIEAEQEGSGTNIISGRDLSYGTESQSNN